MLIAEDLMLLLLDPAGRTRTNSTRVGLGLAGAVMLELAMLAKVDVAGPGEQVKAGRLVVRDATPTGDPVLDEGLRVIAAGQGRRPQDVLNKLEKGLKGRLLERLVRREAVQHVEGRVLGIFPTHAWPPIHRGVDTTAEGIRAVLVHGLAPSQREAALIGLLRAVDCVPQVVGDVGIPKRELRRRAKAVPVGDFAGEAVRKAIEAIDAAAVAAASS